MEPITLTICGIALLLTATTAAAYKQYEAVQSKNRQIEAIRKSLQGYVMTYTAEAADVTMIDNCRNFIKSTFGDGIDETFNRLDTVEQREQLAVQTAREMAGIMGINVREVLIDDLGLCTRGYTQQCEDGVKVVLNRAVMLADPQQLVKTMCHELRHCVQLSALQNDNPWGFSDARLAQWLYSWVNYIPGEQQDAYEGYATQAIETDASWFASRVFPE